jgi:hypothetical protein
MFSVCLLSQGCGNDSPSVAPDADFVPCGEDASLPDVGSPDVGFTSRCGESDPKWPADERPILRDGGAVVWLDDSFINTRPGNIDSSLDPYDAYLAGPEHWKMELTGRIGCEFATSPGTYVLEIRRRATDEVFLTTSVEVPAKVVSIVAAYGGEGSPGALVVPAFSEDPPEAGRWRITFANLTHDNIDGDVNYYVSPPCYDPRDCEADAENATPLWEESRFGQVRTFDVPMYTQYFWALPEGLSPADGKPFKMPCIVDGTVGAFVNFCDSVVDGEGPCQGGAGVDFLSLFGAPCYSPLTEALQ